MLKRAEASPKYRGMKSGVIVAAKVKDAEPIEREGGLMFPGEVLLGGWARVNQEGMDEVFHAVTFSAYDQGRSRWKSDPAGMITKCAQAGALRKAFPSQLSECYMQDEMRQIIEVSSQPAERASAGAALQSLPAPKDQAEKLREQANATTVKPNENPSAVINADEIATAAEDDPVIEPTEKATIVLEQLATCTSLTEVEHLSQMTDHKDFDKNDQKFLRDNFAYMRDQLRE